MASRSPHSTEFVPLEIIPEEDPSFPFFPNNDTVSWAKSSHASPAKRYLSMWRCSHARCNSRPWSKRALFCRGVHRPFWSFVTFLGLLKLISLFWHGLVHVFPDDLDTALDAWMFPGGRPSVFSHWTTHGVVPVACHSHNDYWRHVPLLSALAAGCISVEADVYLSGNELLVGHTRHTLARGQNLRNLYLAPLLKMLQEHNTGSINLSPDEDSINDDIAGVFANDPTQTLVLVVDFKRDGERIWPHLVEQLEPLREAGYLTHVNGSSVIRRPITIVVSGNAPFHRITELTNAGDIFFDAPLDEVSHLSPNTPADELPYNAQNSYYASVDFQKAIGTVKGNRFSQDQLATIRHQVRAAHEHGLKVRYWGTPSWPRGLRNHVWHVLVREGVDVINVDDLRDATQKDWRKHRSWLI
ncbi:hypothetical protein N7510_007376 [Penicillium lagena]|uniref:uncharacterized protein n=1 Tax=Penicillium lagena TaxID=94218 RepID=UPI00253F8EC0|nr:uncharacterized protein N7510_007376 [Penicillium lagena]KAJ5610657.1 hypothetical protein N7510_007376 [Penicillium lagena]